VLLGETHRLATVAGLGHDLPTLVILEKCPKTPPDNGMLLDEK
jgi:hypothetical protein